MTKTSPREQTPGYIWVLAAAMMLWMVVAITLSQWQMAPTFDEQNHVTRGISVLRTDDFRLCFHHPPFANVLEALPVAWQRDTHFTTAMPSWHNLSIWNASNETIWQLSKNGVHLIKLARIPVLLFMLVLALVVFLWSKSLFGPWGGLLSLGLLALDPNMLAHAGLATTDIPAVSTILLAVFLLRRYIFAPTRANLCFAGLAAGVALATKFSALILIPVTGLLLLLVAFLPAQQPCPLSSVWMPLPWWKRLTRVLGTCVQIGLVAALVVWGIYGFKVEPLGAKSGKPLSAHASFIKRILIPGKQYFRGLKTVKGEAGAHRAYLLGRTDATGKGWWYYFPVAMATKTPIAELLIMLGMLALLAFPSIRNRLAFHRPDTLFLLVPAGIYFFASLGILGISLNLGIRHILPIYPFLFILAGGWVALHIPSRVLLPALALLGLFQLSSILLAYPNFLAYFNELAGGANNGYRILADSNYDWGQDLGALAQLQRQDHRFSNLSFSYFGTTPPEAYGITYHPLAGFGLMHQAPPPNFTTLTGYLAISATELVGGPAYNSEKNGVDYRPLLKLHPVARAGKTIFVYQMPPTIYP